MASEIKVNTIKDLGGNTIVSSNGSGTITGLPASAISSGTVATARLGSGTASSSTFLAGDSSYKTVSGTTINTNADNRVITGSGTANTLNGEANLTYDGSTLTVKPASNVHQLKLEQNNATDYWSLHADSSGGPLSFNRFTGGAETERMNISSLGDVTIGSSAKISNNGAIANFGNHNGSATETALGTSDGNEKVRCFNDGKVTIETAGSERMKIAADGAVLINTSNNITGEGILHVKGVSSQNVSAFQVATNGNVGIRFFNATGSGVGSITVNSSSTSYGTSSDYRLKENEVAISDGITKLKNLKPYRFNFKTEPDTIVDGFFAHEVSSVVPEAISGTKDAMAVETRYTADDVETQGDTPSKKVGDAKTYSSTEIDAQGIDQSKLVPLLTSALQEAITKIETLETENTDIKARLTALENA